jgi:hypothetical protein
MRIRIESAYSDGHCSTRIEEVAEFVFADLATNPDYAGCDEDEALNFYLSEFSGDGHGAKFPKLGWCYEVTVLEADNAALVGHVYENCGS